MFLGKGWFRSKAVSFSASVKRAGEICARVKVRTGHARRGEHQRLFSLMFQFAVLSVDCVIKTFVTLQIFECSIFLLFFYPSVEL